MSPLLKRFVAAVMILIFANSQLAQAGEAVESICVHHMQSIGLGPDQDPLEDIKFVAIPPEAKQQSQKFVPSTLVVLDNLPRSDDDYKAIYPQEKMVSSAVMGDINYVRTHANSQPMAASDGKKLSDTFEEEVKSRPEGVFLIVGHNDGGNFRFRDGSIGIIGDMELSCARAGKLCVFVSCHSKSYLKTRDSAIGVVHALSFAEALDISSKVKKYIDDQQGKQLSIDALGAQLSKQESRTKLRTRIVYIVVKACHVAGPIIAVAILIESLEECDGSDSKCPKPHAS